MRKLILVLTESQYINVTYLILNILRILMNSSVISRTAWKSPGLRKSVFTIITAVSQQKVVTVWSLTKKSESGAGYFLST